MIVAGGTYRERCVAPAADLLFGSGGRATLALRDLELATLHTFHPDPEEVRINFGAAAVVHSSSAQVTFDYLHPLARPRISPDPHPWCGLVPVQGNTVVRFGCLEGEFVVTADTAVYDPQSGASPAFAANGSKARRLALVLNAYEACMMAGVSDVSEAARLLLRSDGAEVVVVKHGPSGAFVFEGKQREWLPAHWSPRLFKIGSGDVFTATFAHYWATAGLSGTDAANLASRHVATYVSNRTLPVRKCPIEARPVYGVLDGATVGLAADARDIGSVWLRHEAREALLGLGATHIVEAERGVEVDVVLALIGRSTDGALIAAFDAIKRGRPCVAFSQDAEVRATLSRAGALALDDFAASIYATAWIRDERSALFGRH